MHIQPILMWFCILWPRRQLALVSLSHTVLNSCAAVSPTQTYTCPALAGSSLRALHLFIWCVHVQGFLRLRSQQTREKWDACEALSAHQLQPELIKSVQTHSEWEDDAGAGSVLSTREKLNYNLLEVHFKSNLKSRKRSSKCYTVAGIKFMFFFGHRLVFTHVLGFVSDQL